MTVYLLQYMHIFTGSINFLKWLVDTQKLKVYNFIQSSYRSIHSLSCWTIRRSSCCSKNGRTCSSSTSEIYCRAVKFPSSTTRGVLCLNEIPAHTITLGPPHGSASRMQQFAYRSLRLRHTRSRPSGLSTQNLDSSENKTVFQRLWVQLTRCCVHNNLLRRRNGVRMFPRTGLRHRSSRWRRRRRTVGLLIRGLCLPGVSRAVRLVDLKRFRRCSSVMCRSCSGVVTLSLPGRGLSSTEPVSAWRSTKFLIAVLLQPKWRATWL